MFLDSSLLEQTQFWQQGHKSAHNTIPETFFFRCLFCKTTISALLKQLPRHRRHVHDRHFSLRTTVADALTTSRRSDRHTHSPMSTGSTIDDNDSHCDTDPHPSCRMLEPSSLETSFDILIIARLYCLGQKKKKKDWLLAARGPALEAEVSSAHCV